MKKSVHAFSVSLYLVFLLLSKQHHHNFRDLRGVCASEDVRVLVNS